jgi:hypothetical protein
MPSIVLSPSVSVPASVVSVSSASSLVTYEQIKASLGNYVFGIKRIYIQANPLQLTQPFLFVHRDANGDKLTEPLTNVYDPYQAQNTLDEDVSSRKFILNGFTNIVVTILANQSVSIYFDTIQLSNSEIEGGNTPFFDLVKQEGFNDFFSEFNDKIEVVK